ncbi:glycosyltransferase family 39 protein [Hyphomicrobium sp. LHD-15]|uniref:glycosyltransferase family 39 protein n=1 Tax=Hyphomicrobium sp. LHD-15 TaxID=3072142 RepID=UPI00280C451A|nr:glycosyltransferase family 39 protein [Hyphomicrobium sp. LHD-15]MDQ8700866.1 glycosyltransferase family 39 protein [Hyphomicrobium sp. LHD-15]
MRVSVVVPTLNEVENVDALLAAILAEGGNGLDFEILIADGGSTDGTVEQVRKWEGVTNVRLVVGDGTRGLAGDVLKAAALAVADIVVVMDADLSHPPGRIRALVNPVMDGSSDMVVGSRFVPGGATPDWPFRRLLLSRLGSLLAWPLTEVKDPMSGFFAVRRDRLLAVDPEAAGFKIGLEVIAHGGGALRVSEVPIVFPDRIHGESKIGKAQLVAYLRRLFALAGGAVSAGGVARFAAVGLIGMFVDMFVFLALSGLGATLITAHITSFLVATLSNYVLNSRWSFAESSGASRQRPGELYLRFFTVCLLALAIRGGILAGSTDILGASTQVAILYAIGAAALVTYLGSAFFVFPFVNPRVPADIRWRVAAIGVASYVIVLRLLFVGLVDLLPQEAYYWNYSQHLDISYLDHPPMVAWLIWAGTNVFGDNEFGVRVPAWLSWFVTAFFSFKLTHRLFGKSAAFVNLLLIAALPFYFATGFFMTPDAPLLAAWAGALYFLERALVGGRSNAWWGVGVCIGLGMLSKYTIALLMPAALFFLLVDVRSRIWLKRPEPYLAAALAMLIFSPVLYWNLENGFASFFFQGTRRLNAALNFSLPMLVFNAAILITPAVLISAVGVIWTLRRFERTAHVDEEVRRHSRFILISTLVPLCVFLVFSLTRDAKLNWTGPVWLSALPAIAASILSAGERALAFERAMRRVWVPTIGTSLVAYGLLLNYLTLGVPGLGYALRLPDVPVAWSEFGREAADLELEVMQATGTEPFMIGLDTYNVASELAFYNNGNGEGATNSVGRGVLGKMSLMYEYWHDAGSLRGRPAVMFAFKRSHVVDPALAHYFGTLGDPMERVLYKDGLPAGSFYYRVGYDFQGGRSGSRSSAAGPVLLTEAVMSQSIRSPVGGIGCEVLCYRSRSVRRRAGRRQARDAARRPRAPHRNRSIQCGRGRPCARRRLQTPRRSELVRTDCGARWLRSGRVANGPLGERAYLDVQASRAGAPTAAMVSLVLLLVVGCATEQIESGRVARDFENEGSNRGGDAVAGSEETGTCASIASTFASHFRKMEDLRRQEEAERRAPPATIMLAYGRLFGPDGSGYEATEKLRQERIKVNQLEAMLAAKGCSGIKSDASLLR